MPRYCPLCNHPVLETIGRRSDFGSLDGYAAFVDSLDRADRHIVVCRTCGLQFIDPMYEETDFAALYHTPAYAQFMSNIEPELTADLLAEWERQFRCLGVTEFISSLHLPRRPTMLDVGCGMGRNLEIFRRLGFDVHGIDLNEAEVKAAQNRFDVSVECVGLEKHAESGRVYDCILASHVLEHVADPNTFFALLSKLAAPNGLILIETPVRTGGQIARERYCDIYHTLFFDHFTLSILGALHGREVRLQQNIVFQTHPPVVNLFSQVGYTPMTVPGDPLSAEQIRTMRSAYDGLFVDAEKWVWESMQRSSILQQCKARFTSWAKAVPALIRSAAKKTTKK